jgi:class 3 adenylate cyclase
MTDTASKDLEIRYYKNQTNDLTGSVIGFQYQIAEMSREVQQMKRGFELIAALNVSTTNTADLESLRARITEEVNVRLQMDLSMLLLPQEKNRYSAKHIRRHANLNTKDLSEISIFIPPEVTVGHKSLLVNSVTIEDEFIRGLRAAIGVLNFILTPIIHDNTIIAYLFAGRNTEGLQYATRLLPHHAFVLEAIGGVFSAIKTQLDQNTLLEEKVVVRTHELNKEMQRSENLLLNILPADVVVELKKTGHTVPRLFNEVTVLLTDFVNFTQLAEQFSPDQLVMELDICFRAFDDIVGKHSIEKIKTIGDAYLAVSGLPAANDSHAVVMVQAAIEMRDFMLKRKEVHGIDTFGIRLGIHSGPVIAGVVGSRKFAFDIWGDTVNTAARMEQSSVPGKINISEKTYQLIKHEFRCGYRGEIEAKNKGLMSMYFVD